MMMKLFPHSPQSLLLLITLLLLSQISLIPSCLSQSNPPQNIETFYPPPSTPSPATTSSSSNGKIVKAVASTAAATFVLCGVIFFIVHRCLRRRKKQEAIVVPDQNQSGTNNNNNGFERIGGNVKGLIVDENGLDVVYWRKLQGRSFKGAFKKEVLNREHQNNDDDVDVNEGKKIEEKVQEFPLLRGKSSTSHLPEGDDYSNRKVVTARSNLPSVSAIPRRNSSAPPTSSSSVPARKSSPPARSRPRPVVSKPPPSSHETPVASAAGDVPGNSSREGLPESGSSQVKLKPLHWDRMNSKSDVASLSVNQDIMEALFGYVAVNRRSPKGGRNDSSSQNKGVTPQGQIRL